MNEKLLAKLEQKILETLTQKNEIEKIVQKLSIIDDSQTFVLGISVGRLYNSFYYQSKRIQNREPTNEEFEEFLDIIKKRKIELEQLCS